MIFSPAGDVATATEAVPPPPPVAAMKFTGENAYFRQLVASARNDDVGAIGEGLVDGFDVPGF